MLLLTKGCPSVTILLLYVNLFCSKKDNLRNRIEVGRQRKPVNHFPFQVSNDRIAKLWRYCPRLFLAQSMIQNTFICRTVKSPGGPSHSNYFRHDVTLIPRNGSTSTSRISVSRHVWKIESDEKDRTVPLPRLSIEHHSERERERVRESGCSGFEGGCSGREQRGRGWGRSRGLWTLVKTQPKLL